jgi:hypothetical protein
MSNYNWILLIFPIAIFLLFLNWLRSCRDRRGE